jgi:hypothetical protein
MPAHAGRIGNDRVFMVARMGVASSPGSLLPASQVRYVTFVAGFRQMTLAGAASLAASGQDGQSREAPRGSGALG